MVHVDHADPECVLKIVTNAKHIEEEDLVVVALEGAIVPAGAEYDENDDTVFIVKKKSVGG